MYVANYKWNVAVLKVYYCYNVGFDDKSPAEHIIESNLLPYFIEFMQHEERYVKDNASTVISQIANTNEKCGDVLIKSNIMNVINKVLSNYSDESWPTVSKVSSHQ